MRDTNLSRLIAAAEALRPLLGELVFVGGCVTGLLITDDAAAESRGTLDVDAIADISSYAQYIDFGERLRALGFTEDVCEGAPVCRWTNGGTVVDIMPLDESILGFSNRWYKGALDSSRIKSLSMDLKIRMVSAPYFIATKFEAFKGRGKGEFVGSHDLEDLVYVIDGRETLAAEIQAEPRELGVYIREQVRGLLTANGFMDALPGYLLPDAANQSRIAIILRRLKALAS